MKPTKLALGLMVCALASAACGVKGNPLPPEVPPEIGRGRPESSSAFEELMIPVVPEPTSTPGQR